MTRRIAALGIGFICLVLVFVLFRGQGVEVVGNLPRQDVAEICRVVSRAEVAMEQPQFPPGLPRLSWRRVSVLPTCVRIRMANRIVSITKESDDSLGVVSISGLWGKRQLRIEKRGGHWVYVRIVDRDSGITVL